MRFQLSNRAASPSHNRYPLLGCPPPRTRSEVEWEPCIRLALGMLAIERPEFLRLVLPCCGSGTIGRQDRGAAIMSGTAPLPSVMSNGEASVQMMIKEKRSASRAYCDPPSQRKWAIRSLHRSTGFAGIMAHSRNRPKRRATRLLSLASTSSTMAGRFLRTP